MVRTTCSEFEDLVKLTALAAKIGLACCLSCDGTVFLPRKTETRKTPQIRFYSSDKELISLVQLFCDKLKIRYRSAIWHKKPKKEVYCLSLDGRQTYLQLYDIRKFVLSRKWKVFERLDYLDMISRLTCYRLVQRVKKRIKRPWRTARILSPTFSVPLRTVRAWISEEEKLPYA